jgi:KipI family sensor histidine kinase inhibitor
MIYQKPNYRIMGDRALLVELGDEISPSVNRKVRELFITLERHSIDGLVEAVPSYRSLLIVYNPQKIILSALRETLDDLQKKMDPSQIPEPKTMKIPVVYGGEYGPDLAWVARYHGIAPEEAIIRHMGNIYQVYMIGFTPGFAYMGELPENIATPRRETPRTAVPAGSVGIAQSQTGIYPVESPAGWQIIGQTPLRLFDETNWPPALLEMGDSIQFFPIKEEEMAQWKR